MDSLIVFLSGIPKGITVLEISAVFSELGFKISVVNQSLKKLGPESRISCGYCLLKAGTYYDYQEIMGHQHLLLFGRRLIVKPYLRGYDLIKANKNNNKRRILLKKVPSLISDLEVKTFLEKKFGGITEFYQLKSHKSVGKTKNPKTKAFSVLFEKEILHFFKTDLSLEMLPQQFAIAELFSYSKKKTKLESRESLKPISYSRPGKDEKSEVCEYKLATKNKTSSHSWSKLGWVFRRNTAMSVRETSETSDISSESRRPISASKQNFKTSGQASADFSDLLLLEHQHAKPNSRIYRLLRSHHPEYLGTFDLKDSWVSRTNLRENILTSSQSLASISASFCVPRATI